MAKKRRRTTKQLELILAGRDDKSFEALHELSESELAEFGFFRDGKGGFTIGKPLSSREYLGEGFPELDSRRQLHTKGEISFSYRFLYGQDGELVLELAQNGSGRYFSFPFRGLDREQAHFAADEFSRRLYGFLYSVAIFNLFSACFHKQLDGKEAANQATDLIVDWFKQNIEGIVKPKRFKEVSVTEHKGVKIVTSESVDAGRPLKTYSEREDENRKFVSNVFKAFQQLEREASKKTKLRVSDILYPKHEDSLSALRRALQKLGRSFTDLKTEYEKKKGAKN